MVEAYITRPSIIIIHFSILLSPMTDEKTETQSVVK